MNIVTFHSYATDYQGLNLRFPMVFLWSSYDFPIFLWCSYDFLHLSTRPNWLLTEPSSHALGGLCLANRNHEVVGGFNPFDMDNS